MKRCKASSNPEEVPLQETMWSQRIKAKTSSETEDTKRTTIYYVVSQKLQRFSTIRALRAHFSEGPKLQSLSEKNRILRTLPRVHSITRSHLMYIEGCICAPVDSCAGKCARPCRRP